MSPQNRTSIIRANLINIAERSILPMSVTIKDGLIYDIKPCDQRVENYIVQGFVDAHVHIESAMIAPSEFARLAVRHGTVATVSDPHEIGNVLGADGVRFMIKNGEKVPFKFYFGAPSCVPATNFETAGATISVQDIECFFREEESVKYLAEMMNYPGVLSNDEVVMEKIAIAKKYGKVIDGHAPALRGDAVIKYASAGISTDHECVSAEEALGKLQAGMKILIREGSAAKNFDALIDLLPEHYENIMFCSDDKHPDDLIKGHINHLVVRAINRGLDFFKVLECACCNPVKHYGLDVGQLRIGDEADFIIIDNLTDFNVLSTYIGGQKVAENGQTLIPSIPIDTPNVFHATSKTPQTFDVKALSNQIRVIEALDGELITHEMITSAKIQQGSVISDIENDILKFAVVNRYEDKPPALAFIKNFGFQCGAIASSIGHDSHNILAVGVTDEDLSRVINLIIESQGGIAAVFAHQEKILPLPVAGIMSAEDGFKVARKYQQMDQFVKQYGTKLNAPFMTLAFMALLVIPDLKLSDQGLFSGQKFAFTNLFV